MEETVGKFIVRVEIDYDASTEGPREYKDEYTFMWTQERRFNSPDKMPVDGDVKASIIDFFDIDEELSDEEQWEQVERKAFILPVFKYDHSGVAYSTTGFHCPWDSGHVGYIFTPKSQYKESDHEDIEHDVLEALRAEVQTYSAWANGEVYRYTILDGDEIVDSCGEYYGEPDRAMAEGIAMAKNMSEAKAA